MADEKIKEQSSINEKSSMFEKNLDKFIDLASWMMFYPDLFLDLNAPKEGGIKLHLDQRVFLRCATRFFSMYGCFPRGYGKCIVGDSLIYTDNGIKEIGELFNYQNDNTETIYNHSVNLLNRNGEVTNSNLGIYSGYHPTKKITTCDGYELEGTLVHPILVMDTDGEIKFKQLQDIQEGDYAVISRKNNLFGNNVNIDREEELKEWCKTLSKQSLSHLNIRPMPKEITEDIALLIGYLIGDGCLTLDYKTLFSNIDEDILSTYKRIIANEFQTKVLPTSSKCDFVVNDKYLRKYLELIGLGYGDSHGKSVPKVILDAPKNIQKFFLRGLFDTDGTVDKRVVNLCSVSKKLISQVQIMLLNFGIITHIYHKVDKVGRSAYILNISGKDLEIFNKEIGFGCSRKQDRLRLLVDKKRNTNKDVIPFQKENIKALYNSLRSKNQYLDKLIGHYFRDKCNLTYSSLEKILELNGFNESELSEHFTNLNDTNYYYSKISSITDGQAHVYDFHVPDTHSFVSNGFVSHNTFDEVLAMFIVAIRYPNIELALTAQTKENAALLLRDKYNEIVRYYPFFENEIVDTKFSKGDAFIRFKNDARIDNLANAQSSKGQRRKRINIEESALMDNTTFEDALKPIVEVGRITCGKLALVNPEELNQQIHFFTTPSFRGSDEYQRSLDMVKNMIDLKGDIVLGSNWMLPCWYGRGSSKSTILKKKKDMSPISFDMNYDGKWTGTSSGALVSVNKLMSCRTLAEPMLKSDSGKDEIYMAVDVARSEKKTNNQSSIAVGRVLRNSESRITGVQLVNLIHMSNTLNFATQACIVKRIKTRYNAQMVVVDGNGIGSGLIDELMKSNYDPKTNETYPCWDTVNTTAEPESPRAEKCLFDLKAQSDQTKIISTFINMIDSGVFQFLESRKGGDYEIKTDEDIDSKVMPYVQQELFFQEVCNLKLKQSGKNLSVEKVASGIDKDRFSAVAYLLYYIEKFKGVFKTDEKFDAGTYAQRLQKMNRKPRMF